MEEEDSGFYFTDKEKYQNYLRLVRTIKYIESNGEITPEWMNHHKDDILTYRDWITDYSNIHEDMEDKEFRELCKNTEKTIQHLCYTIYKTYTFDVAVYLVLLRQLVEICDTVFSDEEIGELLKMMSL